MSLIINHNIINHNNLKNCGIVNSFNFTLTGNKKERMAQIKRAIKPTPKIFFNIPILNLSNKFLSALATNNIILCIFKLLA